MAKIVSIVPKLLTSTLSAIAPEPPKPVAIAAPVPTPDVTAPVSNSAASPADDTITGPNLSDDLSTIETRSRGRLGTIATSFRGVLADNASPLPRRTLLGE